MHEKILQGVTVGVVAGLLVYWLTNRKHPSQLQKSESNQSYKPLIGDVRTVRFGPPTCACCQCCGLPAPENTTVPLATDYLCCAPDYAPPVSDWNLGVSIQVSCHGVDLQPTISHDEMGTSFPIGVSAPNTTPRPVRLRQQISCSPNVCGNVCCGEVV